MRNRIMNLEKWLNEAWQKTGRELLAIKIPRDILWKEQTQITFPFFHFLEQTRNKFLINEDIVIIPEYRIGTPSGAKCWGDKHVGIGRSIFHKYEDSDSFDVCIVKFNDYISKNSEKRCSYWCYRHDLLVAIEFKCIGRIRDIIKVRNDINKLGRLCKKGCKGAYVGVYVWAIKEKEKEKIKDKLIGLLPKNKKIKLLFGSNEIKGWRVYSA